MILSIEPQERRIFELVRDSAREIGVPAYAVGGWVRDRLLGRPSKDIDIVTVGDGIALAEKMAEKMLPRPRVVVYRRFGTAMLRSGDLEIEFVGARKESYNFDSRKPAVEPGTLEDDQNRRDFTINAMAISLCEANFGELIDPFDGLGDLERKIIRTPLEPGQTFSDDPLRMLRAARFATQLDFSIEKKTLEALGLYRNRLEIISPERITGELEKIILARKPSVGFKILFETGLLQLILPELTALRVVEDRNGQLHKDNFFHTLEVLDNTASRSKNLWLRWAAILHDIGKTQAKRFDKTTGWTFHGHQILSARDAVKIFKRLRLPLGPELDYVKKMVEMHHRPTSLTKEEVTASAIRRLIFDAGQDLDDLMRLCESDITSKNPARVKRYLEGYELVKLRVAEVSEADRLRLWQPPITGDLIMQTFGIEPSRTVGVIKTAVREAILDGAIPNDETAALAMMLEKGAELGLFPVPKNEHEGGLFV